MQSFEELVAEGEAEPTEGWDFSWFAGRATEERPSWGYAAMLGERMRTAGASLDIQTGGGEVMAALSHRAPLMVAAESWLPNAAIANKRLGALGSFVVATADKPELPFRDGSFDLVSSRHPVHTWWSEVSRLLRPGGTFLSQQIGGGTMRELSEAMMGPLPEPSRTVDSLAAAATSAGLKVTQLRPESLRAVFYDIGAVVYFLRKVIWTVPDFTVATYRAQLARLHERIQAEGSFVAHSRRVLIEATKPT